MPASCHHVRVTTRALTPVAAVLLILVGGIVLLYVVRAQGTLSTTGPLPTPLTTATQLVSPSPSQNLVTPALMSPTPTQDEVFTNAKYQYSIVLVPPYHPSSALTTTFNGAHPAAQDVFTVQTPDQEATGSKNCETACPVWDHTLLVAIFGDGGSMTPREWYDAGNVGFSTGSKLEDITISGRPALKITGSARFPIEYVVADGRGQMFDLAYTIRPERPVPDGASKDKLEQMIASFKFLP